MRESFFRSRRGRLIDGGVALALLAGNLFLIAPYLLTDLSSQPWNNDYTYIAIARMFRDQPWTWNAMQYCGAPFAYVYPPLFHVMMAVLPMSLGHAFHLLMGLGYALVTVALYALGRELFTSRFIAGAAAVAYSVLASPAYLLLPVWRDLASAFGHAPWGFIALAGYSEAGHTLAMAATVAAVTVAWRGRWTLAALFSGAVLLLNWPGMIGLSMAFAAVAVARARDMGYARAAARVIATGGVAYGLVAFWISPGFFTATTLLNRVSLRHEQTGTPWDARTYAIVAAAAALVVLALWRRVPPAASFLLAWMAVSGAVIVTFSVAGNYLLPLPHRYIMEFNAALVLALAWLASRAGRWRVAVVALLFVVGAWTARDFLRDPWRLQPGRANPRELVVFQISDWLERNVGAARVFTSGELDGSMNALNDVAQVGGNRQGISNLLVLAAQREVALGCAEPARAARIRELWLRALDARYVVVHDGRSREYFHWFLQPETFAAFPAAWSNGAGDTVYRLPPPESQQAVVVDLAALARLPRLRSTDDLEFLEAYTAWAQGKRPARIRWSRPDTAEVEAGLGANEAVLVKVNHDPGWRSGAGRVAADPIGFLLIHAPAGRQRFALRFGASWDVWLARLLTVLTVLLLLARAPVYLTAAVAALPAAVAYAFMMTTVPAFNDVAEEAFRRIQPPVINPGGIVQGGGGVIAIYGSGFGRPEDPLKVWVGGRPARIVHRGPVQVNVELPAGTAPSAPVMVEVNGCRGNSFPVGE